jgi:dephospho-CoA kinase
VATGSDGLAEVVAVFGAEVLAADGSLDRAAMRRRIFDHPTAREQLEAIVHPRVRRALETACRAASSPYAIASIPLLAEAGGRQAYPWLARVLVVDAPEDVQLVRLLRRDGIDEALARRMLAAQATRGQRLEIADDVIVNVDSLEALPSKVAVLDRAYRQLAANTLRRQG